MTRLSGEEVYVGEIVREWINLNSHKEEVVREYLIAHGFDGLFCVEGDPCGCVLADLAPCEDITDECIAGYRRDGCTEECGQGCEFHVCKKREATR